MKIKIGILLTVMLFSVGYFASRAENIFAYGECSQYGIMATYDSLSDSCKCMSGYVFKNDFMGKPQCVSGDSVCSDKLGYGANYDSYTGSCECRSGYVLGSDSIGRTQCITEDQSCKNQLGYSARSTYGGMCECSYGYVISGGQCVSASSLCFSKHGTYSQYDSLGKSCTCMSGYTFDDASQCVEKQNNVYFALKELDTDEKRAIVRSDYDHRYYLISYNSGCYTSSFRRYVNHQIVVNLGTDFDLDRWDKIVLQDDDEVCDITSVEKVDSSATLAPEEGDGGLTYVPTSVSVTPPVVTPQIIVPPVVPTVLPKPKIEIKKPVKPVTVTPIVKKLATPTTTPSIDTSSSTPQAVQSVVVPEVKPVEVPREGIFKRIWKKFISWF